MQQIDFYCKKCKCSMRVSYTIPTNNINLRKIFDSKKVEMIFDNSSK